MNRIYRTLWSVATQSWQAVPETAKTAGKKSKSSAGGVVASVALSFSLTGGASAQAPPAINQLPTGGTVVRGSATIQQTATAQAAAMTVNQTSQRAVVNWNTFNIGSAASVNFVQPNAQAVTLNRVNDSNPSQIFGRMTSNGQVVLTNANGIYFAPGSSVDVGAITATTHSISNDNFMSGKYVFERNGATGKIVNEGRITAALAGYVALLAPEVQNAGVVVARAGTVAMAAGETITLNIDGAGSLAGITTTPSAIASLIENKQAVEAPDGQIILSAVALNKLQAGVIKNSGSLEASSLVSKGGKIYLEGDDITLTSTSKLEAKGPTGGGTVLVGGDWQGSGDLRQATKVTMEAGATIDASATDKGDGGKVVLWSDVNNAYSQTSIAGVIVAEGRGDQTKGGQIETSGAKLDIADSATIRTGGAGAADGRWLLDPVDFTIASSGGNITGAVLGNSITAGNTVEILNTSGTAGNSGNINVTDSVSWNNSGVLKLTASGGVTGASNFSMGTGGGGLIFNQTGQTVYSGVISGNGSVTKMGAGTLKLAGANTYSGGTTISTGTLQVGDSSVSSSRSGTLGTGNVVNNATLTIYRADAYTLDNAISGSGNLWMNYAGATVTLTGNNTYSGTTTTYGMINIGNGGTTGSLGTGAVTLSNEYYGLTFNRSDNFTVTNDISGGGTLTKLGAGTVTLSGNNSYASRYATSITTINAGTLAVTSGTALSAANYLATVSSGGTLDLRNVDIGNHLIKVNSGGTLKVSTGTSTTSGNVQINGPATIDVSSGAQLTLGGSASFNTTFVKQGAGILTLSNNNALFTAVATINEGILEVGHANAISGTGGKLIFNGGALRYGTGISVDLSSRFDPATANQNYRIDTNGQTVNFGSALSSAGGTLTKLGTGTLSLSGANTYNDTVITAGTLQVGNAATNGTLGSGAVVNNSVLSINRTGTYILNNSISGSGSLTQTGTGYVTISGDNSFTGGININAGNLRLGSNNALGNNGTISFGLVTGTLQYALGFTTDYSSRFNPANGQVYRLDTNGQSVTLASALGGIGNSLYKLGAGTLMLSGNNTYSGTTSIDAGTVRAGSATAFGTSAISVTSGASLDLNGQTISSTGGLTLSGTGVTASGALMNSSSTAATYADLVTLGSHTTIKGDTGSIALTNPGIITGNGFGLTLRGAVGGSIASIIGTGTGVLTKADNGTWTLSGINTYSGNTSLFAGILKAGSEKPFGSSIIDATRGGTLDFNGQTITGTGGVLLSGMGSSSMGVVINSSNVSAVFPGTVTLFGNSSIIADTGSISFSNTTNPITGTYSLTLGGTAGGLMAIPIANGASGITKVGTGTWTLSGSGANNSYSGPVAINEGTLRVTTSQALGTAAGGVRVANGATLELGGPASPSGISIGAEVLTVEDGGSVHNVAGYNTYAGVMTLNGNATITIDTGTRLNFSATSNPVVPITVPAGKRLTLNTNGDLTFIKPLAGANASSTYVKVGSGTLNMGAGSTLSEAIGVYAGLYDLTGTDYSSTYGSTPDYTVALYNAASGGTKVNLSAGTDYSGTVLWTGTTPTSSSNANIYSLTYASGLTVSNTRYVLLGATSATNWTVIKAHLTVTADNASKTYGDANPTLNTTVTGFVNGDTISVVTGTGSATTAATATSGAGTVAITAAAGSLSAANYDFTNLVNGTLTINKAHLTVTADNASKTYGDANPTLSTTVTGFVNGESLATSGVSGAGTATTTATASSGAGTVAITATAGSLSAANYDFTSFSDGVLTVNPRPVRMTGRMNLNGTPTLDTTATGTTLNANNLVGSDTLTIIGTATLAASTPGSQAITNTSGLSISNNNYTLTGASGNVTVVDTSAINVAPLSNAEVATLIGGQLAGLTGAQISSFSTPQLQVFSPQQLSALSPSQLAGMTTLQLLSLSPSQIAAISPAKIAVMTAAELGAFSDAQLQALSTTQLAAIAPANFAAFTPAQIMAMSITQVQNLSPEQLAAFTPAQIASLNAAELAYFDARQLAAIGIFPKVEAPVAAAPVIAPVEIVTTPEAITIAAPTVESTTTTQEVADATDVSTDKKDNRSAFEAPIPVMTEVAAANVPLAVASTSALTPSETATTSTVPEQTAALSPRALQNLLFAPNTETSPRTGVLAITILNSAQATPTTAGIAFEQDADTVSLRFTSAPASAPPMSDKVVFRDKLVTFMVATSSGVMVEFEGSVVNNRMVIVAPSPIAKRIARTEMNLVLAAAVTSLGKENRVMLASLTGVVLDLR